MNHQQGFSLIEVLLALTLTTTVTFYLLSMQCSTQKLYNQLVARARGAAILDRLDESLLFDKVTHFETTAPYSHSLEQNPLQIKMQLSWPNDHLARLYYRGIQ